MENKKIIIEINNNEVEVSYDNGDIIYPIAKANEQDGITIDLRTNKTVLKLVVNTIKVLGSQLYFAWLLYNKKAVNTSNKPSNKV